MSAITLEMVDEVRNRTGADYKLAKEALEVCGGDILEAIIYIENLNTGSEGQKQDFVKKGNEMIDMLKELVNKGLVNRITIEKDDRVIMDIPVLAGLASIMFPPALVTAIVAALATGCVIKILKEDGEELNLNEMTTDAFKTVVEKTEKAVNDMKGKKNTDEEEYDVKVDPSEFETEDEDHDSYIVEAKFMEDGGSDEDSEERPVPPKQEPPNC